MEAQAHTMNWTEEEHFHAMEEEREQAPACIHEEPTGDKRWPVLCKLDNRYASAKNCGACKHREENP